MPHTVEQLFTHLEDVAPYPPGVVPTDGRIPGIAFFPGGRGLWSSLETVRSLPLDGVMVVGQDFHTFEQFSLSKDEGGEVAIDRDGHVRSTSATWRGLLALLPRAGVPLERCFFTNAYMGLRESGSATGRFPGSKDKPFATRCQTFFLRQVAAQRPRLILTLGAWVPRFLAPLSDSLRAWRTVSSLQMLDRVGPVAHDVALGGVDSRASIVGLTHPSFRGPNVGRRRYRDAQGDAAELLMLSDAIAASEVNLAVV